MTRQLQLTSKILKNHFGKRLDQVLSELFLKYSRSCIKKWILERRVSINGTIIDKPKKKVLGDEYVLINAEFENLEEQNFETQNIPLNIVYEDHDILVINKQNNLVVHPGAGNPNGTLLNALLYYYPPIINIPRAGILHRLDKQTTGLMIVAKTILAQRNLIKMLQLRKITREYEAIVIGILTGGGTINKAITRHFTKRKQMTVDPIGKAAITHYRIIERFNAHTHLRIRLETGRTHQIRVHMAHINHPLVGDPIYGGCSRMPKGASNDCISFLQKFNRQALHAIILRFYHPITGIKMELNAPLPLDMIELINMLKMNDKEIINYYI